jgi:hypothetical protein
MKRALAKLSVVRFMGGGSGESTRENTPPTGEQSRQPLGKDGEEKLVDDDDEWGKDNEDITWDGREDANSGSQESGNTVFYQRGKARTEPREPDILWEVWDDGHGSYYHNVITGESQWEEPDCSPRRISSMLHHCVPGEMSYDENHNVVRPPPPPAMKRALAKLGIVRLLGAGSGENTRENTPSIRANDKESEQGSGTEATKRGDAEYGVDVAKPQVQGRPASLGDWLEDIGLSRYRMALEAEGVETLTFLVDDVEQEDLEAVLVDVGMKRLHRAKFVREWRRLLEEADEAAEVYDDSHFAPPDLAEADVPQAVEQLCNRLYENGYLSVPDFFSIFERLDADQRGDLAWEPFCDALDSAVEGGLEASDIQVLRLLFDVRNTVADEEPANQLSSTKTVPFEQFMDFVLVQEEGAGALEGWVSVAKANWKAHTAAHEGSSHRFDAFGGGTATGTTGEEVDSGPGDVDSDGDGMTDVLRSLQDLGWDDVISGEWEIWDDGKGGPPFYHNVITGATQWTLPEGIDESMVVSCLGGSRPGTGRTTDSLRPDPPEGKPPRPKKTVRFILPNEEKEDDDGNEDGAVGAARAAVEAARQADIKEAERKEREKSRREAKFAASTAASIAAQAADDAKATLVIAETDVFVAAQRCNESSTRSQGQDGALSSCFRGKRAQ